MAHAARPAHVSESLDGPSGGQLVLDDITLDVAPGEFVTLLGASGCGKSTLLNLVAGLDRPSTGTIETPGGRPPLRPVLLRKVLPPVLAVGLVLAPWQFFGFSWALAVACRSAGGPVRAVRRPGPAAGALVQRTGVVFS